MSSAMSLRLPDNLNKELEELAKITDRSKTFLVRKAIEAYIEEYSDYRIALDRLLDKDDEIVGSSDIRSRLGI